MPPERALLYVEHESVIKYNQRRLTRKTLRAIPWLGGIVAIATLGAAVRRKGMVPGTLDTTLDVVPYVGGLKNMAEIVRGRDFIPDKHSRSPR